MIKTNDLFSANKPFFKRSTSKCNFFLNIPFTILFHVNPKGHLASDDITSYTENSWNYFPTSVWDNIEKYFVFPKIGINLFYRETLWDFFFCQTWFPTSIFYIKPLLSKSSFKIWMIQSHIIYWNCLISTGTLKIFSVWVTNTSSSLNSSNFPYFSSDWFTTITLIIMIITSNWQTFS